MTAILSSINLIAKNIDSDLYDNGEAFCRFHHSTIVESRVLLLYRSIRDDLLKKVVRELLLLAAYYRFLAYYRSIRDSLMARSESQSSHYRIQLIISLDEPNGLL